MDEFINTINEASALDRLNTYQKVEKHLKEKKNSNNYSLEKLEEYLIFFKKEWGKQYDEKSEYTDRANKQKIIESMKTIERIEDLLRKMIKILEKMNFENYIKKKMKDPDMAKAIKAIVCGQSNYNDLKL